MKQLEKELLGIYRALINKDFTAVQVAEGCHSSYRMSAMNLVRYITLRNQDLRIVHDHLSELGISSLRSCEAYVMHNVISSLRLVKLLNGEVWNRREEIKIIGYKASKKLLSKHTKGLFQVKKKKRATKIMVTLPLEAAYDPKIVQDLLLEGMEIARIDLAEHSIEVWKKMVSQIKRQSKLLNLECRVYIELAGFKLHTGQIEVSVSKTKTKNFLRVQKGEHLILTSDKQLQSGGKKGTAGIQLETPIIALTSSVVIEDVKIGQRVYFDDGKIQSRVIKKTKDKLEVIITSTSVKAQKLKSHRNINLPDTLLGKYALTKEDRKYMPFAMEHADILGFSNARCVENIKDLHKEMNKFERKDIGIVIKVENQEAFENLPMILLEAMKKPRLGVMIARGDLSVELGAERIAEVQDQVRWICEAAHIPVIWASQVLNEMISSAKKTRAEITDAAQSSRSECVMLNSGPFVTEAVGVLSKILEKMQSHTSKKKNVMRALKISKTNMDRIGIS